MKNVKNFHVKIPNVRGNQTFPKSQGHFLTPFPIPEVLSRIRHTPPNCAMESQQRLIHENKIPLQRRVFVVFSRGSAWNPPRVLPQEVLASVPDYYP
jgi:hypothetical protein